MGGSQFELFGEVRLDTGPAAAGVKQISSQIQGLAQSGIAGFEAVQQKVVAATKEVAALRNALLQTQDPAQQKQLNAQLTDASTRLRAAKVEMRGMSLESREANEKVQMLAASLGVQVPQGLAQILARMPAVQTAMELAFSGLIVVGFGAAIVALFPKIAEWIDRLRGVEKVNQDILNKQIELNTYLAYGGKPEVLAALTKRFNQVANDITRIRGEIERLQTSRVVPPSQQGGPLAGWLVGITAAGDKVKALKKDLGPLEDAYKKLDLAIGREKLDEHNKAMEEAKKHAKELAAARWDLNRAYEQAIDWNGEIVIGYNAHAAAMKQLQMAYDQEEASLERIPPLITDQEFALKHLPPVLQEIQAASELANEATIKAVKAQDEAAKKAQANLEQTAGKIESFIDRVFLTARSLSDVFHQFLMQTLGSFVKWISQMLASWLTGIRQATAGAAGGGIAGGGGGLLGSLLGGLFGLGTGTPAAAATGGAGAAAWAGAQSLTLPGGGYIQGVTGPLEAGAIGTLGGGIPQAVGGATQGTLGALAFHPGQFLAGLPTMLAGMGILGGIGLASSGGPVRGALGGALAGGGIGLGLYSLGLLGGPWGLVAAGIGAAIGGLVGLFRRGGQKKKASGLEQGFEFAANDLFEQFKQFKIDYESALSGMQALILQGQQSLTSAGLGRWGRQGAENLTRVIQDEIRALEALEKQREARATLMAGMTIPEFAVGGSVSGFGARGLGLGGGILAILHPGEFVMRREVVDALGQNFLTQMNRAPRFDAGGAVNPSSPLSAGQQGGIHIHGDLVLYPAKDMSEREAMRMVVRGFKRAVRDGAL